MQKILAKHSNRSLTNLQTNLQEDSGTCTIVQAYSAMQEQNQITEQCFSLCRVIINTLTEAKTRRELTGNESVFLESAEHILKLNPKS